MEINYMINEKYAKSFCCEDISLIENYELAINDTTQTWDCHHRRGTIYTRDDLKKIGEYYNRPAIELIFLTSSEHHSLHNKGKKFTEDHKRKIGDANRGKIISEEQRKHQSEVLKGRKLSEEHKKAISDGLKGHSVSETTKKAIGDAHRGIPLSEATKKALSEAHSKKILQLTKSREFIKEWHSAYEAARELGVAQSSICRCCNGKFKYAGGYIWKYA